MSVTLEEVQATATTSIKNLKGKGYKVSCTYDDCTESRVIFSIDELAETLENIYKTLYNNASL